MLYHPGKNKSVSAKEKFVEVYRAHEVLIDYRKRQTYDSLLNESVTRTERPVSLEAKQYEQWESCAEERGQHYSTMNFVKFAKELFGVIEKTFLDILPEVATAACLFPAVSAIHGAYHSFRFFVITITILFAFLALLLLRGSYLRTNQRWRGSHRGLGKPMENRRSITLVTVGVLLYCAVTIIVDFVVF